MTKGIPNIWMTNPWAEEKMRTMFSEGLSFSQITKELSIKGLTRNAVIGKAHRLGLKVCELRPWAKPLKKIKPKPGPKLTRIHHREHINVPITEKAAMQTTEHLVHLFDAQPDQCRWVCGEASDMLFCGAPIVPNAGHKFCEYHANKAYTKSTIAPQSTWINYKVRK